MIESLEQCIIMARSLQQHYHNMHHLAKGVSFSGDHKMFGKFYEQLDGHYDRLSEYYVSETDSIPNVAKGVAEYLDSVDYSSVGYSKLLEVSKRVEEEFMAVLVSLDEEAGIGLKNLVGEAAEASDVRSYKLKRRTTYKTKKKDE